jgi:hypothetical protein
MSKEEAEERIATIHKARCQFEAVVRRELLELHDRKGYRRLNYKSWAVFGKSVFNYERTYLHYLVQAAIVERNLELGKDLPTAYLRELARLKKPEDQRRAYGRVQELIAETVYKGKGKCHEGKPSQRLYKQAVDEIVGARPNRPIGTHGPKDRIVYFPNAGVLKTFIEVESGAVKSRTFTQDELEAQGLRYVQTEEDD